MYYFLESTYLVFRKYRLNGVFHRFRVFKEVIWTHLLLSEELRVVKCLSDSGKTWHTVLRLFVGFMVM